MVFLSALRRRPDFVPPARFAWSPPPVRDLADVARASPVTFLVGENGSGKSTLREGLPFLRAEEVFGFTGRGGGRRSMCG